MQPISSQYLLSFRNYTMLEHYQTHAKAGQRSADIKDRFVDDTE